MSYPFARQLLFKSSFFCLHNKATVLALLSSRNLSTSSETRENSTAVQRDWQFRSCLLRSTLRSLPSLFHDFFDLYFLISSISASRSPHRLILLPISPYTETFGLGLKINAHRRGRCLIFGLNLSALPFSLQYQ